MMTPLYDIKSVNFHYKWNDQVVSVLQDLNLSICQDSFACIVGPSGTGKTTLLNLLGLVEPCQEGQMFFDGTDISNFVEKEKQKIRLTHIGFVFQSFYLIPTLSVVENTSYFLRRMGQSKKKALQRSLEVLSLLGLDDQKNKYPKNLSGGQRQRVAIARAIAKKPKVLLADEPTANLDAKTARTTIEAFQKLREIDGTSFIFSTHDARLVKFAEQTFEMSCGKVHVPEAAP